MKVVSDGVKTVSEGFRIRGHTRGPSDLLWSCEEDFPNSALAAQSFSSTCNICPVHFTLHPSVTSSFGVKAPL